MRTNKFIFVLCCIYVAVPYQSKIRLWYCYKLYSMAAKGDARVGSSLTGESLQNIFDGVAMSHMRYGSHPCRIYLKHWERSVSCPTKELFQICISFVAREL